MKKDRMKRNIILLVILVLSLLLLGTLNKKVEEPKIDPVFEEVEKEEYISKIKDYQNEYNNTDIIAELVVKDLEIDTLITKSTNNTFYLDHDIYKNDSNLGNPFVDYRNSNNLGLERQINIYSHNSDYYAYQEKLPFYKIEKLLDKEAFEKTKSIYLLTEEEKTEYEIVAIKIVTTDNEHTVLDSKSDERWNNHLTKLLSDTTYCKGECKLDLNDKLLILQTCNYNPKGSYIVLISKKKIN